jgi:hypothetical protein
MDDLVAVDSAVADAVANAKPFVAMKNPKSHIASPSTETATSARLTATTVAMTANAENMENAGKKITTEDSMPTTASVPDEDLDDFKQNFEST